MVALLRVVSSDVHSSLQDIHRNIYISVMSELFGTSSFGRECTAPKGVDFCGNIVIL